MRYNTMSDLQYAVRRQATDAQRVAIAKWEATGWYIFKAKYEGIVGVILMAHEDAIAPLAMYPDGTVQRAIKGKRSVEYSWVRARKAYNTMPVAA